MKKAWNSAHPKSWVVLIKPVRKRTDPTNQCSIALRLVLIEHIAIERAVLDGFLDVLRFDFGFRLHVGDGASHSDDFVVSPGAESKFRDSRSHALGLDFPEWAILAKFPAGHLSVGQSARGFKALVLERASRSDLIPHHCAGGACGPVSQFIEGDSRDLDMNIDPIEQWARDTTHVTLDLSGVAIATAARIGPIAAWARV